MTKMIARAFSRNEGPLKQTRHEAFARARAEGRLCAAAYRLAGYPPESAVTSAYALDKRDDVMRRKEEIRRELAGEPPIPVRGLQESLLDVIDCSIWDFMEQTPTGMRLKAEKDIPARLRPLVNELSSDANGNIRIKLRSKDKAVELLLRTMPGALAPAEVDIGFQGLGDRLDRVMHKAKTIDVTPEPVRAASALESAAKPLPAPASRAIKEF
jgi:hypothetical protein